MGLAALGFVSEQHIKRWRVDELHAGLKLIVEVNGDYAHGNLRKYRPDDVITFAAESMTVAAKHHKDRQRCAALGKLGYHVFVVWESDDYAAKRAELVALMARMDAHDTSASAASDARAWEHVIGGAK